MSDYRGYPPRDVFDLERWTRNVEKQRKRFLHYFSAQDPNPSVPLIPLIALVDEDGELFARITPKLLHRISGGRPEHLLGREVRYR